MRDLPGAIGVGFDPSGDLVTEASNLANAEVSQLDRRHRGGSHRGPSNRSWAAATDGADVLRALDRVRSQAAQSAQARASKNEAGTGNQSGGGKSGPLWSAGVAASEAGGAQEEEASVLAFTSDVGLVPSGAFDLVVSAGKLSPIPGLQGPGLLAAKARPLLEKARPGGLIFIAFKRAAGEHDAHAAHGRGSHDREAEAALAAASAEAVCPGAPFAVAYLSSRGGQGGGGGLVGVLLEKPLET